MLFGKRERVIRQILIVEDEPLVAFDNEHFLSEAGYEIVATVDTLDDALQAMNEHKIDLILCDIRLRGAGDGLDVARHANAKGVPVLIVSALSPPANRELAIGYLGKPYTDKMLVSTLEVLDQHLAGKRVKRLPPGLKLYERT